MNNRINLPQLLIDGVVIVISILLAFGIDAWWDQHQQGVEEQIVLRGWLRTWLRISRN